MIKIGVTEYALAVLKGDRIAGNTVKLACRRHLEDLCYSMDDDYPYYFNPALALQAINFLEITKPEDIEEIADFHKFIMGSIYGWVRKDDNSRRYTKAYIQVARKNAKTYLISAISLYATQYLGIKEAQCLILANTQKQAGISFNYINSFIKNNKFLKKRQKSVNNKDQIIKFKDGSFISAMANNVNALDGWKCYVGIIDEYHIQKDTNTYNLIRNSQVQFKDPLLLIITTAGLDITVPCYNQYTHCKKILNKEIKQDNVFAYIAEMDDTDDVEDSKNWIKSNPLSYYNSNIIPNIKRDLEEAKNTNPLSYFQNKVKSLNMWITNMVQSYLDINIIEQNKTEETLENYKGHDVIVGVDLSCGGDLTSICFMIKNEDIIDKYYIYNINYMPRGRLQEHINSDKLDYNYYEKIGNLKLIDTLSFMDFNFIKNDIIEICNKYELNLKAIAIDPAFATSFRKILEDDDISVIDIKASLRNLNEATVLFKNLMNEGLITYNKNQKLFILSCKNAITVEKYGFIKIDKDRQTRRIDPIDSAINAMKAYIVIEEEEDNIYDNLDLEDINSLYK